MTIRTLILPAVLCGTSTLAAAEPAPKRPVSADGWEGVGVVPDIAVPAESATDVAFAAAAQLPSGASASAVSSR